MSDFQHWYTQTGIEMLNKYSLLCYLLSVVYAYFTRPEKQNTEIWNHWGSFTEERIRYSKRPQWRRSKSFNYDQRYFVQLGRTKPLISATWMMNGGWIMNRSLHESLSTAGFRLFTINVNKICLQMLTAGREVNYNLPGLCCLNSHHHIGWVLQFRMKWRAFPDHPAYFLVITWPSSLKRPILASKAHLNSLWDRGRENRVCGAT